MQSDFVVAAAQFSPFKGDIEKNTEIHQNLIELAAVNHVDVVIFPELSLTGYEYDFAASLAFTDSDPRLDVFKALAQQHNIMILIGAPIAIEHSKPQIGLFVISPAQPIFHYSKIYLHLGEEQFFTSGSEVKVVDYKHHSIGLAICADTGQTVHAFDTVKAGGSLYFCSVLITEKGYAMDTAKLQRYAQQHEMTVVMANYSGLSGGMVGVGRSAIWDKEGALLVTAPEDKDCIVIANIGNVSNKTTVIAL